jgi:hypothetical protein
MSLIVEVGGFAVSHGPAPHFMLIICAQQENFQAWTVYRRCQAFSILAEQLRAVDGSTPPLPYISADITMENMANARDSANNWLQTVVQNPVILRTPSMYQFLCADANLQPPDLEVFWKHEQEQEQEQEQDGRVCNGDDDVDMDMDDMFRQTSEESPGPSVAGLGAAAGMDIGDDAHSGLDIASLQ